MGKVSLSRTKKVPSLPPVSAQYSCSSFSALVLFSTFLWNHFSPKCSSVGGISWATKRGEASENQDQHHQTGPSVHAASGDWVTHQGWPQLTFTPRGLGSQPLLPSPRQPPTPDSPHLWWPPESRPSTASTLLYRKSESYNTLGAALKEQHQGRSAAQGQRAGKPGTKSVSGAEQSIKCSHPPQVAQANQAFQRAGKTLTPQWLSTWASQPIREEPGKPWYPKRQLHGWAEHVQA